jgi:HemY protein
MRYLLWILLLFVIAVGLSQAAHNSAYFLLIYPPYRIEFSLILFVVLTGLIFIFGYVAVRLLSAVLHLPETVRAFRAARAQTKQYKLLQEAITLFFAGRYADAERVSVRAMKLDDSTYELHTVIAARAAHALREYDKRDAYLSAAEERLQGDATMGLMAMSEFMLAQQNPQGALDVLRKLQSMDVKAYPAKLTLELKAQQQVGNWDEVLKMLKQLEKHSAIDAVEASQLRQQAWLEKIGQQESLPSIQACLSDMPTEIKRGSQVCKAVVCALIKYDGGAIAQQLLEESLQSNWDSELVSLYGDCVSDNPVKQIDRAEKWLQQHNQGSGLLLALGKLCVQQQLWGKAKNYLEASISVNPTREAWIALGKMAGQLGQDAESSEYFRQAMEVSGNE